MSQEGSKYQEMIKIQMIKEIEIDQNYQNTNRIEINDEDNEKQSCIKLMYFFLIYNLLLLFDHS